MARHMKGLYSFLRLIHINYSWHLFNVIWLTTVSVNNGLTSRKKKKIWKWKNLTEYTHKFTCQFCQFHSHTTSMGASLYNTIFFISHILLSKRLPVKIMYLYSSYFTSFHHRAFDLIDLIVT